MAADDLRYDWSPSGAYSVEVEWIIPESGRFGRDRHVAHAEATHARITEHGGSEEGERVVTRGEADAYIAQLERAAIEHQADEHEQDLRHAEWLAGLASTCAHCGDHPRQYDGERRLQSGGVGAEMVFGVLSVSNFDVHVYTCGYCGSIELFQGGSMRHPLSGNASA
jgi:hypothetical protein